MLFAFGACHFLFNLALQEGHSLVEHHGRYLFRCHRLQTCQKQRHVGREINVGPHAWIPAPAALSILQSLQMVDCRCFVDRHRWRVKQQGQRRCPFPFRLRLGRPRRFSHQHLFQITIPREWRGPNRRRVRQGSCNDWVLLRQLFRQKQGIVARCPSRGTLLVGRCQRCQNRHRAPRRIGSHLHRQTAVFGLSAPQRVSAHFRASRFRHGKRNAHGAFHTVGQHWQQMLLAIAEIQRFARDAAEQQRSVVRRLDVETLHLFLSRPQREFPFLRLGALSAIGVGRVAEERAA